MTTILNRLRAAWRSTWRYASAHKVVATIVALVALYGGYQAYAAMTSTAGETSYVTTTVATSTVVSTLSESGQVSSSQTLSLSPKASGQVIGVYVKPGDHVYAGQIIAQLDATDALQSLQAAKLSLQHAELSYTQTTAASTLALNLVVARNGVTNAEISLQKAHDDAYNSIASIYSDLGTIVTGLDSLLHSSTVAGRANQKNIDAYADLVSAHDYSIGIYKNSAETSYTAAYDAYQDGVAAYKATSRTMSDDDLAALAKSTYATVETIAEAVKDSHDFFDRVTNDYSLYNLGTSATLAGLLSSTNTYTTTVSTDLGDALSSRSSLVSAKQALAQAENTLQQAQGGANTLTVQSAQISLQQAKDAVTSAQTTVNNYSVIAPFTGTIGSVGVQRYDQASSGTSVATLVAEGQTAKISVSEADAAQIKVGEKATLTFDALPDVTIAGTVASIDSVGSVSSGVVSYDAVIVFDTQNANILPGMSVTADIVTGTATGLAVPNSAIKAAGTSNYVLVFDPPLATDSSSTSGTVATRTPTRVTVTTGLAGDAATIVTSGLTGGEQVVTKTTTGTTKTISASSSSGSSRSSASSKEPSSVSPAGGPPGGMMMGL